MKRKRWIAAFAAEGALCAGLTLLLRGDALLNAGLLAFPFAQVGAGLRALSLLGGAWNVLAIVLYAALSLLPAICFAALCRKRKPFAEDGLLILTSLTLFGILWAAVNPAWLARNWPAGRTLGISMLGGVFYSEIIAYAVLRLLRVSAAADAKALRRYVRWMLALLGAAFVYGAFGGGVQTLLTALEQLQAGNTADALHMEPGGSAGAGLLWTQAALVVRYLVDASSSLLSIRVILEALRLLAAQDSGNMELASECASKIAGKSAQALRFALLSGLAVNLLQVLLAKQLRNIALDVSLPLGSVMLCLAALLLARLMQENRKLREDNDLFI